MPRFICHLALLLVLVGCSAPKPPAWTSDPSILYPPEAYLTGLGFDHGRSGAEDRARAEIVRIFPAGVSLSEIYSRSLVASLAASKDRQTTRPALPATTDKTLSETRIAEVWTHPETGDHYALAILDRLAAARPLRRELNDIDLALSERMHLAEEVSSPARRLGHYLSALAALERRQLLAADLAILEPSGVVADPPHVPGNVAARVDRAAAQIRIGIELAGDRDDIVKGALVRTLAAVGMKLAPEYDRNLTIRGRVQTRKYAAGDPWQWTVSSAQVDLLEGEGEAFLDNLRTTVRDGSRQAERAETLARENLGRKLAALLVAAIGDLGGER